MWQKSAKKCLFTLTVDGYAPEITNITFPLFKHYAHKIGADFHVITERKFPDFPPVYEKLQIYELAKEMQNDWNIFLDADALIHPDSVDYTNHLPKDHVLHNAVDVAGHRWRYDRFFRRDGRNIGSCNWFAIASDWCIELWKPLDDLTLEEAVQNIFPTTNEKNTIIERSHLIDDYTLSRNIAKYGLKCKTAVTIMKELGYDHNFFFYHEYTIPIDVKLKRYDEVLKKWGVK